jgi:predicted Fe-Mo cluster-binding NifX family protein
MRETANLGGHWETSCVCPECGEELRDSEDLDCSEERCSKCGARMERDGCDQQVRRQRRRHRKDRGTRIAVPSDDHHTVTADFGRARGFVIYEVKNEGIKRLEYRCGTFTGYLTGSQEQRRDSRHDGTLLDALADCDVVVSRGMSSRLEAALQEAHIRHLLTQETDVIAAVNGPRERQLDEHFDCALHH